MLRYLIRRALHAVAIVAFATAATFVLLQLAPGDAVSLSVDQPGRDAAARQALRARLGLDRPVTEQAVSYLLAAAHGDLGMSHSEQRPVRTVLADALPATIILSGSGLLLAVLMGVTLGTIQGWRPNNRAASVLGGALTLLYTLPEVIVGIVLLAVFGLVWGVLPVSGMTDPIIELTGTPAAQLVDRLRHLLLPASALALVWSAAIVRQQRVSVRDVANALYVRTARAKGISDRTLLWKHVVRPALPTTIAVIGLLLPVLAGGTVIIEALFSWPGMGSLLVRAVALRDAPLVGGAVMVMATAIAGGTLLTESAVGWLDPRSREGRAS